MRTERTTPPVPPPAADLRLDESLARRLAGEVLPGRLLEAFLDGVTLSPLASWLTDSDADHLVVVMGPSDLPTAVDEVLSQALAWQVDRDLLLVLSDSQAALVLPRLPWIRTSVQVWTHADGRVIGPRPTPGRAEVLESVRATQPLRRRERFTLDEDEIVRLAPLTFHPVVESLSALAQSNHLAWHAAGRPVLSVRRAADALIVEVGETPTEATGTSDLPPITVARVITRAQVDAAVHAIESAILQHATPVTGGASTTSEGPVATAPQDDTTVFTSVTAAAFERRLPAYRGVGRRAVIDLLGWEATGRFHVVSTGGGDDQRIVLQALDHAIWVSAHAGGLRRERGLPTTSHGVVLDLVLSPTTSLGASAVSLTTAVHPFVAPQLEALATDVVWQVHLASTDGAGSPPTGTRRLSRSDLWSSGDPLAARPFVTKRWTGRVEDSLRAAAPTRLGGGSFYGNAEAAFLASALPAYADVRQRQLERRFHLGLVSDQAFGLNLFGGLEGSGLREIWGELGFDVHTCEPSVFEWEDASGARVDIMLRATTTTGRRVTALVQVRLAETDTDGGLRAADDLALATAMVERRDSDEVVVVLCAPAAHRLAWRRFAALQRGSAGRGGVRATTLPAESVARAHRDEGVAFLARFPL